MLMNQPPYEYVDAARDEFYAEGVDDPRWPVLCRRAWKLYEADRRLSE